MRLSSPRQVFRRAVRGAECVASFLRQDRHQGGPINPGLLVQGFFSSRAQLYPFERHDARWFVNDWAIENRFRRVNPPSVQSQLGNKLFLHLLLRDLGFEAQTVPLLGVLNDGRFTSCSRIGSVAEGIAKHGCVVIKPVDGFGGHGVVLCTGDGAVPSRGAFVVEEPLQQHPYAAAVFPGSVNTVRVLALRLEGEEPFIAGAAHRFGRKTTVPVDNFSRGGIAAGVDLATGMLRGGRTKPGMYETSQYAVHPDTGAPIEGLSIPMWAEVTALALELMRRVPGVQMVGWDICVTPDGPRLIEGNGSVPNPDLLQTRQPLLLDAATRRFFCAKGVISQRRLVELEQLAASPAPAIAARAPGPIRTGARAS